MDMDLLFSSSSSEDDEIDNVIFHNINQIEQYINNLERYSRRSIEKYVEHTVQNYSQVEFIKMFCLKRGLVEELSRLYEVTPEYIALKDNGGRPIITAFKQFLIYLRFVGHEAESYDQMVDRFNISRNTVFTVITRISNFLCDHMGPQVIKLPTAERKNETKEFYYQNRFFPGVIGSLDGTHIRIDRPVADGDNINRKKYYSVQVQVLVNESCKFYDVFVGYPGSVHDARVFRASNLYRRLPVLCENDEYILGDSAYPCLNTLLIPYRDNGNLTRAQRNYNYIHSQCRVKSEHGIGKVKQRFRSLYHIKLRKYVRLLKVIYSCFVLSNLADQDDYQYIEAPLPDEVWQQPDPLLVPFPPEEDDENVMREFNQNGTILRDEICRQLNWRNA